MRSVSRASCAGSCAQTEPAEDTAQWPGGALWAQAQTLLDAPLHMPSAQVLQQGAVLREQLKAAVSTSAESRRAEVRAMQAYRSSIVLLSKPVRLGRVPRLPALLDVQAQRATRALEALEQRWRAVDAALAERLAAWADALSSPTARAPKAP